ncbi:NADPH-dependent FMN reductase [Cryptosporangium aurantiacum]|uniref:NAD(P)H-dependent FMN reductase n=1 Tax=Cryptosporangium aurantiacum TaxID=134849 RepID=A0A1M7QT57_9ACTN|nr:NADPH-dependent FMN reductase [Cryptosporangium aurantiacum]SHN34730.1 NAD(P)H-dependent FMN reductase [Cryptosporangium aurantiacum]
MSRLQIIVASTRPGRVGLPIGQWVEAVAEKHGGFDEIDLSDLGAIDLPLMDEPHHPRLRQYTQQHTKDWAARVDAADAFVFVLAEYNHSYTAGVKNAIDYLNSEWGYKPAGLVTYGGVSGGLRAGQALKPVLQLLKVVPLAEQVTIPFVQQFLTDGAFVPNELIETSATTMLDELGRWAQALHTLRAS